MGTGGVGRVDRRRGWGWGGVGRVWTSFGVLLCCHPFCLLCPKILDPHVLDPHVHRLEIGNSIAILWFYLLIIFTELFISFSKKR